MTDYWRAAEAGRSPSLQTWIARYPHLAEELTDFFAAQQVVDRLAAPLRVLFPCQLRHQEPAPVGTIVLGREDTTTIPADPVPQRVGDYELLEEIARGGMGVVYRARQVSLNRIVAVKMILAGPFASADDVQRFRQEAEAAAHLDHPHIVPIYEIGEWQAGDGRPRMPYFSMKLIEGSSLASFGSDPQGSASSHRQAARIMATVACAVHYAHQRGILHRDLKPANILLDARGEPHVTDFGLAKRVEGDSALTCSGTIAGTPSYMAPEQAAGEKRLTTAVDVYSLGALLCELITGQPPFRGESPLETLMQVRSQEPPRPRSRNRRVDRDLETICLKCLEKDPERRYGSALVLADDLERWLRGEPIQARRAGAWERGWKWARRQPVIAALSAAVLGLVVALVAILFARLERAEAGLTEAEGKVDELQKQAEQRQREARLVAAHLALERGTNRLDRGEIGPGLLWLVRGLEEAPADARELHQSLQHLLAARSQQLYPLRNHAGVGVSNRLAISPDRRLIAVDIGDARREPVQVVVSELATSKQVAGPFLIDRKPAELHYWIADLVFSPDGKLLASVDGAARGHSAVARLWDLATGKPRAEMELGGSAVENGVSLVFSPDGLRFATLTQLEGKDRPRTVCLWEIETGKRIGEPLEAPDTQALAFSPDGKILITAGKQVCHWDPATAKPLPQGTPGALDAPTTAAAFSPDGTYLLTAGVKSRRQPDGSLIPEVVAWGRQRGVKNIPLERVELQAVTSMHFSPDGKKVVLASRDEFGLWEVKTGHRLGDMRKGRLGEYGLDAPPSFSPDSKAVVLVGPGNHPQVFDTRTGEPLSGEFDGAGWEYTYAVFAADSKRVLTSKGTRAFRPPLPTQQLSLPEGFHPAHLAYAPDGKSLYIGGERKGTIEVLRRQGDQPEARFHFGYAPGDVHWLERLHISPDGKTLLTAECSRTPARINVRLWDTATGTLIGDPLRGKFWRDKVLPFRPDSKAVLIIEGNTAQQYDTRTARPTGPEFDHREEIRSVAYSPDGNRVLTAGFKTVRQWDAAMGEPIGGPIPAARGPEVIGYTADGKTIVGANHDRVNRWDAASGRHLGRIDQRVTVRSAPLLYPGPEDGRILVGIDDGRAARLWDAHTGGAVGPILRPSRGGADLVAWNPDGRIVATVQVGIIQLWERSTGKPLGPPLRMQGGQHQIAFHPNGKSLVGISEAQRADRATVVEEWTLPAAADLAGERLRLWVEVITGLELDEGGEVRELSSKIWQQRRDRLQRLGGEPR
jgi:WD40 repeat protein